MEVSMFRRGFFLFRILGVLLFIGLLAGAGTMIYQAGQAQGFAMAAASAGRELPVPMPFYGYGMMYPHFSPFGMFFGIIPLVLVLFVVGGVFRRIAWGRHHMGGGPWAGGPHPHHHWGEQPEKPAEPEKPAQQPPSSS
jgi:hypothetical protein